MPADSGTLPTSFFSEVLGRQVSLGFSGESSSPDCVIICLGELLFSAVPAGIPCVSFESGFVPEVGFRLSLESLNIYSEFLAVELLRFLRDYFGNSDLRFVLVGRQFSSVLALFTVARFPEVFRGVLSFSGSFWWKPVTESSWEWLTAYLAKQGELKARVCLLCSDVELLDRPRGVPTVLLANRHLRDVLLAMGSEVCLLEFAGDDVFGGVDFEFVFGFFGGV